MTDRAEKIAAAFYAGLTDAPRSLADMPDRGAAWFAVANSLDDLMAPPAPAPPEQVDLNSPIEKRYTDDGTEILEVLPTALTVRPMTAADLCVPGFGTERFTVQIRARVHDVDADVRNNVVLTTAGGSYLAICSSTGNTYLADNWLPSGWVNTHESSMSGTITDDGNVEGSAPGFTDLDGQDFTLDSTSDCLGAAGDLASAALPVTCQYVLHQEGEPRPDETPRLSDTEFLRDRRGVEVAGGYKEAAF